jgi:hypothetical protein
MRRNSMVWARRIGIKVLFISRNAESCLTRKQDTVFEEFIKNYLYKAETVLKIKKMFIRCWYVCCFLLFDWRINLGQLSICALCCSNIVDTSCRQRGRPIDTRLRISDDKIRTGSNIWSQVPQGRSIPRHSDSLTD